MSKKARNSLLIALIVLVMVPFLMADLCYVENTGDTTHVIINPAVNTTPTPKICEPTDKTCKPSR